MTGTVGTRRKKVLVHAVAAGYGGAERSMELFVPYLNDSCEFVFLVENETHFAKLREMKSDYHLDVIKTRGGRTLLDVLRLVLSTLILCYSNHFDVVVSNTNKSALVMALCRPFLFYRRPGLIVFIRDFQWSSARQIFGMLAKWAVYVAPSNAISELWPVSYGPRKTMAATGEQKLNILPDGMDEPVVGTCCSTDGNDFLILGTVNRWKGVDNAIEALSLLSSEYHDLRLSVVGREGVPGILGELKELARRLGVEDRVIFQGHVDDVKPVILASHCVISATVPWNGGPETFGRTIVEAWSLTRPVIASNCGGPRYLVDHGENGLLFEPGNPVELAAAIRSLLKDPCTAMRMAEKGHSKFSEKYTNRRIADDFLKLIDEAATRRG